LGKPVSPISCGALGYVGDVVAKGFWDLILQGSQSTDSFNWDPSKAGARAAAPRSTCSMPINSM